MSEEKIFIKNMVCHRCVMAVESILKKIAVPFLKVSLGEVLLPKRMGKTQLNELSNELMHIGFELLDDKRSVLIEKIKTAVLKYIGELPEITKIKLSFFISENVKQEYTYLSNLFSSTEGYTIENYFISKRIEKVKELLVYNQLSLSEISYELGFSNVHHLSSQFKKITGLTPTHFKKIGSGKRETLDRS